MPNAGVMPNVEESAPLRCSNCSVPVTDGALVDVLTHRTDRGPVEAWCSRCISYYSAICRGCGQRCHSGLIENIMRADGSRERICPACYPGIRDLVNCYCCGIYLADETTPGIVRVHRQWRGDVFYTICPTCAPRETGTCREHGPYLRGDGDGDGCQQCPRVINNYDFRPEPEFRRAEGEREPSYYLGFELEVERASNAEADTVGAAIPYAYCKTDGSLDEGFEIVSHPLSPAFIRGERKKIAALLTELSHSGVRSYRTNTCGMHVHVSRSAFAGSFHLFKFMEFIYRNRPFVLAVSQREEERLRQWANVGIPRRDVVRKAKEKFNTHDTRYTAVNLENQNTVEVRIFRGTLKPQSFFKNLEFVEAVVEYTRHLDAGSATAPERFVEWVTKRQRAYPNLAAWLTANWGEV